MQGGIINKKRAGGGGRLEYPLLGGEKSTEPRDGARTKTKLSEKADSLKKKYALERDSFFFCLEREGEGGGSKKVLPRTGGIENSRLKVYFFCLHAVDPMVGLCR